MGALFYEPAALTAELWALVESIIAHLRPVVKREKLIKSHPILNPIH
jgi:hypothetical protein